jgi:hypothetical protein
MRRDARRFLPEAERESLALGRPFGLNSVETARVAEDDEDAATRKRDDG